MATAPNVANYYIGKGNVYVKLLTEGAVWRHVGNVPTFEWTPEVETLEHFSAMQGVKTKDRTITLSVSGTLRIIMEEWNEENLGLAFLGAVEQDSEGDSIVEIFSQTQISAAVRFEGTNDVGPKVQFLLNRVDFVPNAAIGLLSDEFGPLEINGNAARTAEGFGYIKILAQEGEPVSEPFEPSEVVSETPSA